MTTETSGLLASSDYKLNQLQLVTSDGVITDISRLAVELNIFEDLFSPVMTGSVLLGDSLDLISTLKLHGNEFIQVNIDKPSLGMPLVKTFRVYKIGERSMNSGGLQNYTIYFCSEELFLSTQILVSKSYKGLRIDQMVSDLLSNKLKVASTKINAIEQTSGSFDIIIPRMSPLEAIAWLTPRAYNANKNLYFFYENRDGFNFISYENLISQTPYDTYQFNVKLEQDPAKNSNGFNVLAVSEDFNILKSSRAGAFSSTVNSFDIINRQFSSWNYNSKQITQQGLLNKSLSSNDFQNRLGLTMFNTLENMLKFTITTDSDPTGNPANIKKWLPQTSVRLGQMNMFKVVGVIPGDILIRVGMVVNLVLPKSEIQEAKTSYDSLRTGKYIVSSVHHKFIMDISSTTLELLTDSVNNQLNAPATGSPTIAKVIAS